MEEKHLRKANAMVRGNTGPTDLCGEGIMAIIWPEILKYEYSNPLFPFRTDRPLHRQQSIRGCF